MNLLRDGMHHFRDSILDEKFPEEKKKVLAELFILAYKFLANFC